MPGRARQGLAAADETQRDKRHGERDEADFELVKLLQQRGRDDRDEQAAEGAAGRDEEKITGQPTGRRFELVEFAVTHHAGDEEC